MKEHDLLTLLLISSGDYHATRCARAGSGLSLDNFDASFQRLMTDDLVEIVGDEIIVSSWGQQVITEILWKINNLPT